MAKNDSKTQEVKQAVSGRMVFVLKPTQERCCRCTGFVFHIEGRNPEDTEYLNEWEHWCPKCLALVLTMTEADVTRLQPMREGQIGRVVAVPLSLMRGTMSGNV